MASFDITTRDQKTQAPLLAGRGMAALLEPILNPLLQVEMTDHLRTEPSERTAERRGWLGGSYERRLTEVARRCVLQTGLLERRARRSPGS